MSGGSVPQPRRLWPSPITAAMAAAAGTRFEALQLDGDDAYWIEGRPADGGRLVVVKRDVRGDGPARDVIAAPFSARSFVHEYGGGALLAEAGHVVFSNAGDGRLYRAREGETPLPLTPELGGVRYADMALDTHADSPTLYCVVEDHRGDAVVNSIGSIPLDGGEATTVVGGNDFYSTPRVSPDGTRICWLTWNQPLMPWEGTELWMGWLDCDGVVQDTTKVAGGAHESVFQPAWSPDSTLHFVSDRTGWWNLYGYRDDVATALAPMPAECGRPQWLFGFRTYDFLDDDRIALTACHDGLWRLHVVGTRTGSIDEVELPYTSLGPWLAARGDSVVVLAGGPHDPSAVVRVEVSSGSVTRLSLEGGPRIDADVRSQPEHLTFPGHAGEASHAWYYRPRNAAADSDAAAPPLLVHAHGGPTSSTSSTLNAAVQYWTSRGIAVLDVDYGGSTGYGRAYRKRLDRKSGVVDVGDCLAGARYLAERGDVDAARMFIEGGSAGGYIVLCAMTFHDVFAAGASLYGIGDLQALFAETHKFEARYEHPYPSDPDEVYARSPVHFADRVRKPLLLLQGLDDPIVPPDQSQGMYDAVRLRGVQCAYVTFAGEGHGFRRAENIERSETAELYFFCRVSGIEPPTDAPPLPIANL